MDTRSLRFFLAVAREKSVKKGAEALHLTQPNVTRTIHELEEELGVQLFIRSTKGLKLTAEGELLRRRAEEVTALIEKTRAELSAGAEEIAGDVYLASGETEGIRPLVFAMARLRREHPGVRFHVVSGNSDEVLNRVDTGLADFGIVFEPVDVTPYDHIRLPWSDTWGVIMREDSPLAEKEALSPDDLADEPLILSVQQVEKNGIAAWFGDRYEKLNVAATYSLINTPKMMVSAGLGLLVGFDRLTDTSPGSGLTFRPLAPPLHAGMFLIRKKNQVFSAAAKAYYEEMLRAW